MDNYPTPQGVSILDYWSDSDDSLPELVTESEGYYSVTVGNNDNTLTSPAPKVTSEGEIFGHGPDKQYPPARWECVADGKMQQMDIDAS